MIRFFCRESSLKIIGSKFNANWRTAEIKKTFSFSTKKKEIKVKSRAPAVPAKTNMDYMQVPEHLKKMIVETRQMQTPSQANLEEESLKIVIIEERQRLELSLKEQIQTAIKKNGENKQRQPMILNPDYMGEALKKYYISRPLRYLQNIFYTLFFVNGLGYAWLEFIHDYHQIGWFYGLFTAPAAGSCLALMLGYNLSFWIVRQAFHLHVPLNEIPKIKIDLLSTTWMSIAELLFIMAQFAALVATLCYPSPMTFYKMHVILATTNFISLLLNLRALLRTTSISYKVYTVDIVRIISLASLLIFIMAIYHIQICSADDIEKSYEEEHYRQRIKQIGEGYKQFLCFFKKKNYSMKQNQKINPFDA